MTHATLCVLSFNRPQFLPQAIESAIAGADEPIEVIVHDDGSSDPSLIDYLNAAVSLGNISTLIRNPVGHNQGQGIALNRMFRMATGDPIIKCDHDMTFNPGWLAKCREILTDPRVGLLGVFKYWHDPVDWRKTLITRPGAPEGYKYHTHICGSVMVIPRHVWATLGPFCERSDAFAEDAEMQRWVHESQLWECALPDEDLATNHGFGVGPSTVVVDHGVVQTIKHEPYLVSMP